MRSIIVGLMLVASCAWGQYVPPLTRAPGDFSVGGDLTLEDSVWTDLILSSLSFRDPPGLEQAPALVTFDPGTGVTNYVVSFDSGEHSYGILQMHHGYKRDSEVRPHIHWTSSAANTSVWELSMNYGYITGGLTNSYVQQATVTNLVPYKHCMSDFPAITDMTNKMGESGIFLIKLKCVDDGGTAADGDPLLLDFDIHYQIDKIGSDNENPYE